MNVVIKHKNQEVHIPKDKMMILERYKREYIDETCICFSDSLDEFDVKSFVEFLLRGRVPSNRKIKNNVYSLLIEWEYNNRQLARFFMNDRFYNGCVIFLGKTYPINTGCLFFHSKMFQIHREFYPELVFHVPFQCDEDSFLVFLDMVHGSLELPNPEHINNVVMLSQNLECSSISYFLASKSSLGSIFDIFFNRNYVHDISQFEMMISQGLPDYINSNEFSRFEFPSIIRVLQKYSLNVELMCSQDSFLNLIHICSPYAKMFFEMTLLLPPPQYNKSTFSLFSKNHFENKNINNFAQQILDIKSSISELASSNVQTDPRIIDLSKKINDLEMTMISTEIMDSIENGPITNTTIQVQNENIISKPSDFEGNIFNAARDGKLPSIKYLLTNGFDINSIDSERHNFTMLHWASLNGHQNIVEFLVEQKANVNARTTSFLLSEIYSLHFIMHQIMVT